MSERLACEAGGVFAGIAADAGAVGILPGGAAGLAACDRSFQNGSLNVMLLKGTADDVVLWTGSRLNPYPGALEDAARWSQRLGCDAQVDTTYNNGVFSNLLWPRCRGGTVVELMSVRDGGHWWWTQDAGAFPTAQYAFDFFTRTHAEQPRASPIVAASYTPSAAAVVAAPGPPSPPKTGAIASGVYASHRVGLRSDDHSG